MTAAISVGIPTLNRAAALGRCLDALLDSTVRPAEIIVIDQGDGDSAAQVARSRATADVAISCIQQQRRGLSAARNEIVRRAQHPIVVVTDDDCVPDRAWLAALLAAFDRLPAPAAVSGRVLALPPQGDATFPVSLRTDTSPADFTEVTLPWLIGTGANFAARRDLLRQIGGYDERLGAGSPGQAAEDLELLLRLVRGGARVRYAPDAVVYHECQSAARRKTTRWSYGYGIGALAGMLLRRGDTYGLTLLLASLQSIGRRVARAGLARDGGALHQGALSVAGTMRGTWYGWRVPPARRRVGTEASE
jgi:GT2 family glycosyltransferase